MFAKKIIDSDAFLEMPLSTQALYFHLSMRADDEGFINNPKKIQRMINASDDDMKVLLAKNFIIAFESGVIVIKHWKIHNYIRSDRLVKTAYIDERALLELKENGAYTLGSVLPSNVSQMSVKCQSNVSIGKDSIGEDSIDKDILSEKKSEDVKSVIDYLNEVLGTRYTYHSKTNNSMIKARLDEGHTVDDFKAVIDKKYAQWHGDQKMSGFLRPETLFASSHFESYLNERITNGKPEGRIGTNANADEDRRLNEYARQLNDGEIPDERPFNSD